MAGTKENWFEAIFVPNITKLLYRQDQLLEKMEKVLVTSPKSLPLPQPGKPPADSRDAVELFPTTISDIAAGQPFASFMAEFDGTAIMTVALSNDGVLSVTKIVRRTGVTSGPEELLDGQTVTAGIDKYILIPINDGVTYLFSSSTAGQVTVYIEGTRKLISVQNPTISIADNQKVDVNSGNITATISGPVTIQTESGTPINATITGTVNIAADQVIQVQNTSGGSLTIAGTVNISAPVTVQTASGTPIQATISGPVTIQTASGTPISATITGTVNIAADQVIQVQNTSGGSLTIAGTVNIGNTPAVTISSGTVTISSGTIDATIQNAQIDSQVVNEIINTTNAFNIANEQSFSVSNLTAGNAYQLVAKAIGLPIMANGWTLALASTGGNTYTVEVAAYYNIAPGNAVSISKTYAAGTSVYDSGYGFNPSMVNLVILTITPSSNISSDTIDVSLALSTYPAATYPFFKVPVNMSGGPVNFGPNVWLTLETLTGLNTAYPLIHSLMCAGTGGTANMTFSGIRIIDHATQTIIAELDFSANIAATQPLIFGDVPVITPGADLDFGIYCTFTNQDVDWTFTGNLIMAAS